MTHTTKQHLQQNFPVIPTGIEYRKRLGTSVVCVVTPESRGKGDRTMAPETFDSWLRAQANRRDPIGDLARDYGADCNAHGLASMTAAELRDSLTAHNACTGAQRALTAAKHEWQQHQRYASRPRAHNLPLTNAAGELEEPLPTTEAERE